MLRAICCALLLFACVPAASAPSGMRLDVPTQDVLFAPTVPIGAEGLTADLWVEPVDLRRIAAADPYFTAVRDGYAEAIRDALATLPLPDWLEH